MTVPLRESSLTFAEEILLLLLDDDGRFVPVQQERLSCALAGAVLTNLSFALRIDTDPQNLMVIDPAPIGDPILDPTLRKLSGNKLGSNTRSCIKLLSVEDATVIRELALQSLVSRGILEQRERRSLWALGARRYPMIDGKAQREVKLRILDVLTSDAIPDPREIALISLAHACDLFADTFSHGRVFQYRRRIDRLRKMDLIGRELLAAIIDIRHANVRAGRGVHERDRPTREGSRRTIRPCARWRKQGANAGSRGQTIRHSSPLSGNSGTHAGPGLLRADAPDDAGLAPRSSSTLPLRGPSRRCAVLRRDAILRPWPVRGHCGYRLGPFRRCRVFPERESGGMDLVPIMGDQDRAHVLVSEKPSLIAHDRQPEPGVAAGKRFVHQERFRAGHHRSGQRRSPLFFSRHPRARLRRYPAPARV